MVRSIVCGFVLLNLMFVSGCGSDASTDFNASGETQPVPAQSVETEVADPVSESSQSVAANSATIGVGQEVGSFRGVVTFDGAVPEPQIIQATKDSEVCAAGEGPVTDVVVNDGKLAGAVVELTVRGQELPKFVAPKNGFVVHQKNCLFTPRLLVAYSGAVLEVHNDDSVEHNVNTGQWNLLQSPGGKPIQQKLNYGGNPFTRVTCNIHSWMEAWVYVARSPFYAASNEAGEFVIEGIPLGSKIRGTITHATLGKQRFTVEIKAGEPTTRDFQFQAK